MKLSFDPPSRRWVLAALTLLVVGCGGTDDGNGGGEPGGRGGSGRGGPGGPGGARPAAAVPVEVAAVERSRIASFIETNGALEAENEVDIVARISAPIVELVVEEGISVRKGQLLARLDDTELTAQLEVSRVALSQAEQNYQRAQELKRENLLSQEAYDQTSSAFASAKAQFDSIQIQVGYTRISAPFSGQIVRRYVDFAQQVSANTPLYRLSDFTPLLCPIQIPERDLASVELGQQAFLEVESWPGQRFDAKVLRISPVVDSATGTIKVTLEVDGQSKLRPGMFAGVFIEIDAKDDALVIPRTALALDSVDDAVYVAMDGVAARRPVTLGFQQGDRVEVVSGLELGEAVVTVGQDGLSDGTPIQILSGPGAGGAVAKRPSAPGAADGTDTSADAAAGSAGPGRPQAGGERGSGRPGGRPNIGEMTPEQLNTMKERMRARGMTDEQIEERIQRMKERSAETDQ